MKTSRFCVSFGFVGLVLAALSPSLVGCEPASCEKVCETQNKCAGASAVPDCAASCEADKQAAEEAGCASEYDARISCQGTLNSCATASFCAAQDAAYLACLSNSTGQGTTTTDSGTTDTTTTSTTK